jgi:hypothetical protein
MTKRLMKDALGASLRAVPQTTADRFTRAEAYFDAQAPSPEPSAASPPADKVVRDGFSMPAGDYALIAALQAQWLQAGVHVTKSEVLRAGLHALRHMAPEALQQILTTVEKVRPGRRAP